MNRRLDERTSPKVKGKRGANRRDMCNLHIVMGLISSEDERANSANLRSIWTILKGQLRKDVIHHSSQIKGDKKTMYLNAPKCSSLRSVNKHLFSRLQ